MMKKILKVLTFFITIVHVAFAQQVPKMYFGDTTRRGVPFSKDPHVIKFKGRYLMYYTLPSSDKIKELGIGIAESNNLTNWNRIAEMEPTEVYEKQGLCAPAVLVIDDTVHMFYQTYGNGKKDAICHAISLDGIHFLRDVSNPIFSPTGDWTCGRAIDAEVVKFKNRYLLYFATRDPDYKIQMQGVAAAPLSSNFSKNDWIQLTDYPILKPELPWEGACVEGASVIKKGKKLFMFYAGSYNNKPQQIGVAISKDGIKWKRLSDQPFLPNGTKGEWNSSESGHPHMFEDTDKRTYLFFQGNNDNGKTWLLSKVEVVWRKGKPVLMPL